MPGVSFRHLSLALLFCGYACPGQAATDEDLFFKSIADVNEGELRFITAPLGKPVHHHQNRITIDDASLETGWIHLEQCHIHLDAVPSSQVVYRDGYVRGLEVLKAQNIGRAWVEGATVQLENVSPDALLCIKADTRALSAREGDSYFLRNGPFHRRFLDGYYPMRVSLSVRLDTHKLKFASMVPPPQPGLRVALTDSGIDVETLFEGRLSTEIRFDLQSP